MIIVKSAIYQNHICGNHLLEVYRKISFDQKVRHAGYFRSYYCIGFNFVKLSTNHRRNSPG